MSEATCVIVGNSIGDRNPALAWRYWKLTSTIALSYFASLTFLMIVLKEQIARVFTSEGDILDLLAVCIPIVAYKYIFDGFDGLL